MNVDLLDVAYIAIGAVRALDASPVPLPEIVSGSGGEMNFISDCIAHAEMLGEVFAEIPEDSNACVFVYEVAEPFGAELARRALAGDPVTDPNEARTIARNLYWSAQV